MTPLRRALTARQDAAAIAEAACYVSLVTDAVLGQMAKCAALARQDDRLSAAAEKPIIRIAAPYLSEPLLLG